MPVNGIEYDHGFNEAGGFLPRKPVSGVSLQGGTGAGFNEAGGFLPRKPA